MVIKYRPEIDGLRALAVIPVILFHMGFSFVKGGFYGVDVFFVISGFLITSNIQKNLQEGKFSFTNFWLKRVRRIMPALLVMILGVLIVSSFFVFKGDVLMVVNDSLPALFSYFNFYALFAFGDYWGNAAEQSFFLHCWSLAVEEQFYIFFPLLLYFIFKKKGNTRLWISLIVILSFSIFLIGLNSFRESTFFMLHTRAWELGIGALIAVSNWQRLNISDLMRNIIGFVGILLISASYIFFGAKGLSVFAFLPVIGTGLIIFFVTKNIFIGRILSSKSFVFIGKISYSLYLWHWPVIVFSKYYISYFKTGQLNIYIVVATVILSLLSYYLVEAPCRKAKHTPRYVIQVGGAILLLGLFLNSSYFSTIYKSPFNQVVFHGLYYDITPFIKQENEISKAKRHNVLAPRRPSEFDKSYKLGGISFKNGQDTSGIIVVGDSHGAMWAKTLHEIADSLDRSIAFFTSVGNVPFFNMENLEEQTPTNGYSKEQRIEYAKNLLKKIDTTKPGLVVFACRWETIKNESWSNFRALVTYLGNKNIPMLIVNQCPRLDFFEDKNTEQYFCFLGLKPNTDQIPTYCNVLYPDKIKRSNERLIEFHSIAEVFDVNSLMTSESGVQVLSGKDILYYDDDHLSYQGTSLLKLRFMNKILSFYD